MIYIVDIMTRKCELVWLPVEINEIIYWRYVCLAAILKINLVYLLYKEPETYKIQNDIEFSKAKTEISTKRQYVIN